MTVSSSNAEKVLDTGFQADGVDVLALNVPGGSIRLRPHDENRVRVRGVVPTATSEPTKARPAPRAVSAHHSDGRLHIFRQGLSADVPGWRRRVRHSTTIHLDIHLPPRLDVAAQTLGGAINAAQLAGTLDLTVQGGSADLEQLNGALRLQGSGGPLTVQDVSGTSLEVEWAAGPVTLEQVTNVKTDLEVQGAPVTVQDHRGPADLRVHGAPLTLNKIAGPCDAEVRGSKLTYQGVPAHNVSLRTVGGRLQSHLPANHAASLTLTGAQVALDDTFAFEGKITSQRIEGTLNGGGPNLVLQAVQGTASCQIQQ